MPIGYCETLPFLDGIGQGLTECAGAKISGHYGNFFLRGQDLLSVPNCTADSSFVIEVSHDDEQTVKDAVYFQTALLYELSERCHNALCSLGCLQLHNHIRGAAHPST